MRPTASTEAYLRRLPEGLESYEGHLVKMSVVRAWVEGHSLAALREALPQPLVPGELLERPVTAWVPEVHATVVYLTMRDLFFDDDDAYVEAAYAKNSKLLRGPLYRVLTTLFSWQRISSLGGSVFARMHRGIESTAEVVGDRGLRWRLDYPEHLVPPLIGRCYVTALVAALEAGGLGTVHVEIEANTPTHLSATVFRA